MATETKAVQHTPGPWRIDGSVMHVQETDEPLIAHGNSDTFSPLVAHVYADGGRLPAEANARLIAAAPELLEALEDLLWQFNDRISDPQDSELKSVAMAEAAIRKAKGLDNPPLDEDWDAEAQTAGSDTPATSAIHSL